jgi:general stress protein 26
MDPIAAQAEDLKKLRDMIQGIDFGMLTTVDLDGSLHSRPMSTNGDVEFDGDLWFFTYASSYKVDEIRHDSHVNVAFAAPDKQQYVSMTGTAELVRDQRKIDELWKPQFKAWFPKGKEDPDIALIHVRVSQAQYWDAPSSPVAHIIALATSLATGKPYAGGENRTVDLEAAA